MRVQNPLKPCLAVALAIILLAAVLTLCGRGMNMGLDFTGGLSMHFELGASATRDEVAKALGGVEYSVTIQGAQKNEALVRCQVDEHMDVQDFQSSALSKLRATYPNAKVAEDVSYVGPVAGATLIRNAVTSVAIASVLMLIYIAWRFDFNSGLAAVLALVHDVAVMLAFMVILRDVVEMNSSFIAAALTIVGYSINDTIVIFDRIRANKPKYPDMDLAALTSLSVKESLGRTIMTTVTTLVTIVLLYILGVDAIREFALPIIVGVLAGTYSSNLLSGYIWAALETRKRSKVAASVEDEDDEDDD